MPAVAAISAARSGLLAPAPGPESLNLMTETGLCAAMVTITISSRGSTRPAAICFLAVAENRIRGFCSSWAPDAFRAARSALSAAR